MKNQKNNNNTSLAAKVAIFGLIIISIAFSYSCYKSVKKTQEVCNLNLGLQTENNKY
jgi:hypothetical protein